MTSPLKQRDTLIKLGLAALAVISAFLIFDETPARGLFASAIMAAFLVLVFIKPKWYPLWFFLFVFIQPTVLNRDTFTNPVVAVAGNAIVAFVVTVFLWLLLRARQQGHKGALALGMLLAVGSLVVLAVFALVMAR